MGTVTSSGLSFASQIPQLAKENTSEQCLACTATQQAVKRGEENFGVAKVPRNSLGLEE